jgi:hypothetical protein
MYSRAGHRWQYGACALHAGYLRLQTHTQSMLYVLLFHSKGGCTNAPQCYVVRTLAVLSLITQLNYNVQYCYEGRADGHSTVYSGARQSPLPDGTNRTVYSPRTVHRRNTFSVTVIMVQWQTQLETPSSSCNFPLQAAPTVRTKVSVKHVQLPLTNHQHAYERIT